MQGKFWKFNNFFVSQQLERENWNLALFFFLIINTPNQLKLTKLVCYRISTAVKILSGGGVEGVSWVSAIRRPRLLVGMLQGRGRRRRRRSVVVIPVGVLVIVGGRLRLLLVHVTMVSGGLRRGGRLVYGAVMVSRLLTWRRRRRGCRRPWNKPKHKMSTWLFLYSR